MIGIGLNVLLMSAEGDLFIGGGNREVKTALLQYTEGFNLGSNFSR